ncbi:(2Fe-2S) ferredoxin domain-containing protein [Nocardiopsis sp. HNM0947]|uniref:(2Fe-2S) ferredoxin domain-containing protein n=1 Tax=Nocardiopsis coralli TaxID=2772213 RepID=A0ABR9P3R1_9ACTN|nr:(2Fe-2S) ferredoxin domain-containing protein [Nocardiopsis coralli]MBE2998471.1 (2Fe-2S) ferredoxin domain-containing protein [Nocardiopsis coralli]
MSSVGDAPCRLTVCRGCCCGTTKKVPGVDHEAQFARLSAIDDHTGRTVPVRRSKCLDICFEANVVVVQPSAKGRAAGGRPVWLGRVTDDELVEALDDWIFEGGPGLAPLPEPLRDHVTSKDAKKPKKQKKGKKARKKEAEKAARGKDQDEGTEKSSKKRRKADKKARKRAVEAELERERERERERLRAA